MKKIVYILFFLFCFHFSYSQNGTVVLWDHRFGGAGDDVYPYIVQSPDSGYLLAGSSFSGISGDKTESCYGQMDFWIVKTNANGVKQWDRRYGGDSTEWLNSVIATSDGGFLLGGESYSDISGDKTQSSRGENDYWIVKIDAQGNKQWDRRFGGSGNDGLYAVCQSKDGGYILGGISNSGADGDKTQTGWGNDDMWIVRIDSNGTKLWDKRFGGINNDQLLSLKITADGGYILCGSSTGGIDGDKTTPNRGQCDGWIVKTDSLGNKQWDKTFGSIDYDNFLSVEITDDGGFLLAGNSVTGVSGDKTDYGYGNYDYWVVKADSLGNKLWDKSYGGNLYDEFWSANKTNDHGFILSGYSQSPASGSKTENNLGFYQSWVVKIDSVGNRQWDKTLLNKSDYYDFNIAEVIQTYDGNYILSNSTASDLSGDKTEYSRGGFDYWLVKLSERYNLISGSAYYDFNTNLIMDSTDIPASYKLIGETVTSRIAFTNSKGEFLLSVPDSGNYTVTPENINYYTSVPSSHPVYFSSLYLKDTMNDFAYQTSVFFNDLRITLSPLTQFRPGNDASYELTYENVGTTTLSGKVVFVCDSNYTFVSSNVLPTFSNPDSVVWTFTNLTPYSNKKIIITVHLKINVPIGTELRPLASIEPITGDAVPGDNVASWEIPVLVTNSSDPNNKMVSRDTLATLEVISGTYLEYLINFQNTGNDTAFIVRILDNISPLLDINTFKIVDVSHPMEIEYSEASRMMIFSFNNILLPDSNINESLSHGFVRYRIKPLTTVVPGNRIVNAAAIYFDFNSPVFTDTVTTQIILQSKINIPTPLSFKISIYPNPLTSSSTLQFTTQLKDAEVIIYDMLGHEMIRKRMNGNAMEIERGSLESGVYFVKVNSGEKEFVQKLIVE